MVLTVLGMALAVHMVERNDPDAELGGGLLCFATACLITAALFLYAVYRWRVVFDAHGIRYRGFLFTTRWPWRDFEEGRVWVGDQSVQHTGKKWLKTMWLGLTADTEDVAQWLARGAPVSPAMQALRARGPFPQPDVPDRLKLRVEPLRNTRYLSLSREGVRWLRPLGRHHERTWCELGPVRFVMRRATDVGFWRLRISLPDKPTEYCIVVAGSKRMKWVPDIGSVIARRYIERVLPADRLEPPLVCDRPQTAAAIDDVVRILQKARQDALRTCSRGIKKPKHFINHALKLAA
mgnify:FL=1